MAKVLGYDDGRDEDAIITSLGLRTLSRISVVNGGMADQLVSEYGSLQEVLHAAEDDPESLGEMGLNNPSVLANSLHRMGRYAGTVTSSFQVEPSSGLIREACSAAAENCSVDKTSSAMLTSAVTL